MAVSDKVKAVLALTGKRQIDLATHLGMSKQVLSNKLARGSWSGRDLAKVAAFCGGKLLFMLPDGQQIIIDDDSVEE